MASDKTYYSVNVYVNDEESEHYIEKEKSDRYVQIDYVVVAKKERGQGIGRKILKLAIQDAKKYKLPIYMVATDLEDGTDIGRLVDFYKSEGFKVVEPVGDGVLMKYRG